MVNDELWWWTMTHDGERWTMMVNDEPWWWTTNHDGERRTMVVNDNPWWWPFIAGLFSCESNGQSSSDPVHTFSHQLSTTTTNTQFYVEVMTSSCYMTNFVSLWPMTLSSGLKESSCQMHQLITSMETTTWTLHGLSWYHMLRLNATMDNHHWYLPSTPYTSNWYCPMC